jgi:diguanylate cyclase (GGDEF)-like protein/PAS domain S-box-containing protein
MSLAAHALPITNIVVSGLVSVSLGRAAGRTAGHVQRACLWFAGTAALWCVGVIVQQAAGTSLSGVADGLTFADLPPLLALLAVTAGVAELAAARAADVRGQSGAADARERWRALRYRVTAHPVGPRLADGYILAAALFVVGWITLFGSEYGKSGGGAGSFAAELLHPLAGLVAISVLLPMAAAAGRRALPPFAAVVLVTVSDALGVSARLIGGAPGAAQQATQLAGFCLLGVTGWQAARRAVRPVRSSAEERGEVMPGAAAAIVASLTAAAAALVVCVWALGGGHATPVLTVLAAGAVLVLAARMLGLVAQVRSVPAASLESEQRFRELAGLTSDVVLVCESGGVIVYASPAVGDYGYSADGLVGTRIDALIHPEDRPGSRQAGFEALAGQADLGGRFPCRVRAADGTWRYVESTVSLSAGPLGADQLLITARDVSDQVALRRQVTHLTFHDGLSGLPNRAYLEARASDVLGRAQLSRRTAEHSTEAGVIFLDLDGFTAVNDSVGHGAGDLLIAQAARRLRTVVPPHETVVRWGGDEFAVLAEEAASAQELVELAERLARSVAVEPFHVAGRDITLTASVGIAIAGSDPPGYVLRNADVAMARAKALGGGRVEVFAAQMHKDAVRRLELVSDLQRAITDGQLVLEYQPVIALGTSKVSGAEALVRWWRGGTAVPPGEFLGVAEESGLIVPLGDWVLRQACAQAARWRRLAPEMGVSVNFSARQLAADGFPGSVLAVLEESGLPPGALTVEAAERVLVAQSGPVVEHLGELRRAGVRLAIDDFGTGYASLAYLRKLPVDIIKIDPSFVAGLGEDETLTLLTRTIVSVGRDLGIEVVAEGIESSRQLGLLRDMGCGLGQGFLVAGPMTATEVESLLDAPTPGGGAARPGGARLSPESEVVVSASETQLNIS